MKCINDKLKIINSILLHSECKNSIMVRMRFDIGKIIVVKCYNICLYKLESVINSISKKIKIDLMYDIPSLGQYDIHKKYNLNF